MNANRPTVEHMTWTGYVRATTDDSNAVIARTMGASQPTVSRWFTQGSMPDPKTAATFARSYDRPVLEAFIAAGYLTAEEAGEKPSAPPSLTGMTDRELLDEVERRMRGGQQDAQAPTEKTPDAPSGGDVSNLWSNTKAAQTRPEEPKGQGDSDLP